MSLLLARTDPTGPTAPGIAANCNNYVVIQEGNSCEVVVNQAGITLDEFYAWNPSLQYSCVSLVVGDAYCVGISRTTSISITVQPTAPPTVQPTTPSTVQPTAPPTAQPTVSPTALPTLQTSIIPTGTVSIATTPIGSLAPVSKQLFWQIHQENGECQTATSISLWFISLWALAAMWSLILGAKDLQAWIRKIVGSPLQESPTARQLLSIGGSTALQVAMTVITAVMLRGSSPLGTYPPHLWRLVMAWFIRPLPATAVSLVSLVSPSVYIRNAAMQQVSEGIYGLVAIGPYAILARHLNPTVDSSSTLPDHQSKKGLHILQAGAILGLSLWCICLLCGIWAGTDVQRRFHDNPKKRFYYAAVIFSVFNLCRVFSGFLIWNGAMLLDSGSFCPDAKTMGDITALWAMVPALDHLYRAVLS